VISATPIVLSALDADGRFTLSAGLGLKTIGLEQGEAEGQSVFDLYRESPKILSDVREALNGKKLSATHVVGEWLTISTTS